MKFLCRIWCDYLRPFWSFIRWMYENKGNSVPLERIKTLADIQTFVTTIFNHFKYTADDITQLMDSLKPPSAVYQDYIDGNFKDDCDGFHTCVYHVLTNNNINCLLLTLITKNLAGSHTVLLFKFENKWYVNDYYSIYGGMSDPFEIVQSYTEIFVKSYKTQPVIHTNYLRYDYDLGKFYNVKKGDVK